MTPTRATSLLLTLVTTLPRLAAADGEGATSLTERGGPPRAIPTFECVGLYWSPRDGGAGRRCAVRYRRAGEGEGAWREGLPLWFDERDGEYRGSIVGLAPGTAYDVRLEVVGTETRVTFRTATWRDDLPVARVVHVPLTTAETYRVTSSGSPSGYVLYTHPGGAATSTVDVAGRHDACVEIDASFVILRGLTLRGARRHGVTLGRNVHDVVIEDCEISGWGREAADGWGENCDSAIHARSSDEVSRIVIQRNRIHHPRSDSNSWSEYRKKPETYHPLGPQVICISNSGGNHVFRYNTVWSDADHMYNDIFGAGSNFSRKGFPNCDSDIYGNHLSHCWDDAIESEGGNRNVRIWGNYTEEAFCHIACASTSVGPLYVWRNVSGTSRKDAGDPDHYKNRGGFLKTSNKMGGGKIYVFHNTILQPPPRDATGPTRGARTGLGWGGPMANTTSRNNVLHLCTTHQSSVTDRDKSPRGDYDFDLYNGRITARDGSESHGIKGVPRYAAGQPALVDGKGTFWLAPNSKGYDAAARLPGFNDAFTGRGPDVGAHEAGTPPMEFGVGAYLETAMSGERASSASSSSSPTPPKRLVPSPDAVASWDARLVERLRARLAAGATVRYYSSATQGRAMVRGVTAGGALRVDAGAVQADVRWRSLTFADRASLAEAVLDEDSADDHMMAAFYRLAAGDDARAREHLAHAPGFEKFVMGMFD